MHLYLVSLQAPWNMQAWLAACLLPRRNGQLDPGSAPIFLAACTLTLPGLNGLLLPSICLPALQPEQFKGKKLPLPLPAHSWHPRHDGKFDAIGHIPPAVNLPASAPST